MTKTYVTPLYNRSIIVKLLNATDFLQSGVLITRSVQKEAHVHLVNLARRLTQTKVFVVSTFVKL